MNLSSETKRTIGLIGCGAWGRNHLRVLSELGVLATVCDPDSQRLSEIEATHPGVSTETEIDRVLARSDIQGLVIASPAVTHAQLALRALEAGKDVLVEKPMALEPEKGEELVDTADRLGRILQVGHVLEYHPAVTKLRELIAEGTLGRIRYLYSNRLNLGRIRTEENALWSFAPHDIAIMLRLLGRTPVDVACYGGSYLTQDVPDTTMTCLGFAGGVKAHIYVSWLHPFKEHRFVVIGEHQMAVFDDTLPWEEKLALYPHRVDWLGGQVPVARRAEANPVPLVKQEPLRMEAEDFLQSIATRNQPLTNGASALEVLRVLATAQGALNRADAPETGRAGGTRRFFAHPTAVVDEGAQVGKGTKIWHFSHVMGSAEIGENCSFGQNCYVGSKVKIGDAVKVQNNVSIYEGVRLEDDVFCGPSVVFTNVRNPRSAVNRKDEFQKTLIGRGATLGANATIVCGTHINEHAFVAAGSVVTRDIPAFGLAMGSPARLAGWMCTCGEKLSFGDGNVAKCAACGSSFEMVDPETVRPQ